MLLEFVAHKRDALELEQSMGQLFEVSFASNRLDGLFFKPQGIVAKQLGNTDA